MRLNRRVKEHALFAASVLLLALFSPNAALATTPCPDTNAFSGITGLSLWLRADCLNGVDDDPNDDSVITTWSDLSGNGNNATSVGTPTFQSDAPNLINTRPVVNFNGSARFDGIDIRPVTRPNLTIFAVYKERGSGNREGVWGIDDGGWDRFLIAKWSGDDGLISVGNQANVANTGIVGTPTFVATVMRHTVTNGTTVYVNGASAATLSDGSSTNSAFSSLMIGSGGNGLNFTGDIAEIIIFDQALASSDLLTVNGYLNTKYNLNIASVNLPTPPVAPTFNSFALAGGAMTATYRTAVNISANVNQSSRITFTANGKTISGCKRLLTSGSGSSHSATCSWKPSNRGAIRISAQAVGIAGGPTGNPNFSLDIAVSTRTTKR